MEPTAPAHQVALFKSAPRDYLNLGSLKHPYLVSYYIDESFYTTWVVRGRTKFKNLNGKDGLRFTISDHQFSLPKVETVLVSELPEYFKATGPGVDVILGLDFLTTYSFIFFKKTQNFFQLSKSCINRCKWPDTPDKCIDFYTAWEIDKTDKSKAGTAAFVNICSPFNTWRPYKPCFWEPKEDIGLCAIAQAMKTASQIPVLYPSPIINIITDDEHAYNIYSPFLKIKHGDLGSSKNFQTLKPQLRDTINRFLGYRKSYADRNRAEELSCVQMVSYRNEGHRRHYGVENFEYALQLAKLGAKMRVFDFKGQLESQLPNGKYYHFDSKTQVFATSKKETNRTLREILQSYVQLTGCMTVDLDVSECTLTDDERLVHGSMGARTSTSSLGIAPKNELINPALTVMPSSEGQMKYHQAFDDEVSVLSPTNKKSPVPAPGLAPEDRAPAPNIATMLNIPGCKRYRHPIDFDLEEDLEKVQKIGLSVPGLYLILNILKNNEATTNEKIAILRETDAQLHDLIKQAEDKGLADFKRQSRNCKMIMAGARRQRNELTADAVQVAKHFKGYVQGHFNASRVNQKSEGHPTQGAIGTTSPSTTSITSISLPSRGTSHRSYPIGEVSPTTVSEITENSLTADAQRRLQDHRLAVQRLRESGNLPQICSTNDIISSIDCRFTYPKDVPEKVTPIMVKGSDKKAETKLVGINESNGILKFNAKGLKFATQEADHATKFSELDPTLGVNSYKRIHWEDIESNQITGSISASRDFSNKVKPASMRVLGGMTWPIKKGGGMLSEVECNESSTNKKGTGNKVEDFSNPIAELNLLSKEFATEHKKWTRANEQANPRVDPHKATTKTTARNTEPLVNIPALKKRAKYPGGALGLANIGGIPGEHSSDQSCFKSTISDSVENKSRTEDPTITTMTPTKAMDNVPSCMVDRGRHTFTPIVSGVPANIPYQELANRTELSNGGVLRSLKNPMGTVYEVMSRSPELSETICRALAEELGVSMNLFNLDVPRADSSGQLLEDQSTIALVA